MNELSFRMQHILFPTDFSRSSEAAAPHVAGLARAAGAKVSLLHVVPFLTGWHGVSEQYFVVGSDVLRKLELGQKATETASLKMLETLKQQQFHGLDCSVRIKTGGVAESIAEYADDNQADLIMMPTRGSGPARPFLIGSVTAKVMHDAHCAIWTSPHPRELDEFRNYRHILCAMDYRVLSPEVLTRAYQWAHLFKSRLSLVAAIPSAATDSLHCSEKQSVQSLKRETISALQCLVKKHDVNASFRVLEGPVGEVVRQAVEMDDADLVVIGRGHLDEPFGHLRTHAYEIIWNSPCPVLSV